MINKKEIEKLAKMHDAFCISIFIPTHRSGQAVQQGVDVVRLKNQLKEVRTKLEHKGLNMPEVERLLKPMG